MANRFVQIKVVRYGYISMDENLSNEEIVRQLESEDLDTIETLLTPDFDVEVLN